MTTEDIRDIYGSEFLNELSLFIYDLTHRDITPERMTKELIIWLEDRGRRRVIAALAEDDAAVDRIAFGMFEKEFGPKVGESRVQAWKAEWPKWHERARSAIRALGE